MSDFLDISKWPALATQWKEVLTIGALLLAGIWTLITYRRSTNTKAAELVLQLEAMYEVHLETMLEIEQDATYNSDYKNVLIDALDDANALAPAAVATISKVDKLLRFFFICHGVRRLAVDVGMVEQLCYYYLRQCSAADRPELHTYMRRFYPTVYLWAPLAGRPRIIKFFLWVTQLKDRLEICRQSYTR